MFEEMIGSIKEDTVRFCYNVTVKTDTARREVYGKGESRKDEYHDDAPAPEASGAPAAAKVPPREPKKIPVTRDMPKVGRNDPCPCGSGKKYKFCHGRNQ